jgi:hypothetical protein
MPTLSGGEGKSSVVGDNSKTPGPHGKPVAKFILPGWGDKVDSGIGLCTGPPGYIGWRAGMKSTISPSQEL